MKKIIVLLCLGLIGCATGVKGHGIIKKQTVFSETEIGNIISVFDEAIKNDPNFGGAYYNRAIANFYYENNYEQCWRDVHTAELLGYKFGPYFLKSLKKASHREK